jgi:hypothetical protein
MNQKIRCANPLCRRLFHPNPRVKNQRYCDKKGCQRARRARWQRHKMRDDPDYRDDHRDGQHAWMERNRDYWRGYRSRHPDYVKRNRLLQKERDRSRRDLANMNSVSQRYFLIPSASNLLAATTVYREWPF